MKHSKRVPYVEQMQQTECGLCCIAMILKYYYSNETLGAIREELEVGRDGLELKFMERYFRLKGMDTTILSLKAEELLELKQPVILLLENEQYAILESINQKYAIVIDPAYGRIKKSYKEFITSYHGDILKVTPNSCFMPVKRRGWIWGDLLKRIGQKKGIFLQTAIISIITYGIQLFLPILIENMIDLTLKQEAQMKVKYCIYFIVFTVLLYGFMSFIRQKSVILLQMEVDRHLIKSTFTKLMQLPYKYFESRANGDLLFRLSSLNIIRDLIAQHIINGVIQLGYAIVIITYLANKSYLLAMVTLGIFALNGFFIVLIRPLILNANQQQIIENTALQTMQTETVYAMFGIKTAGMEEEIFDDWNKTYKKSMKAYQKKNFIMNIYTTTITVFRTVGPFFILLLGLKLSVTGNMTVGAVVACYSLASVFIGTSVSLFNMWNDFELASSYLERVNDITEAKEEKKPENALNIDITGSLEFRNVSFAYTNTSQNVIENISFTINRGEKVAIVGSSGSGKSTLTKLMLGLYEPTAGDIFYDGVSISEVDKRHLRKQLGVVPQDMTLFNKTILKNIILDSRQVDMEVVKNAANISQISEEIEEMPMKYNTLISDMGMNLSGGQRQRIILARAVVNNPKLIILDEATSSLDSINEKKVSKYFEENGSTRIVIAHRMSTIIDADKILVMDNGQIAECGTHEELMEKKEIYYTLYQSQGKNQVKTA
ncbi:peptidase domain-containing ABC transporter [Anaeromicropila herbilytica]|uniref:Peptidase C39 n=1 Tax=Anaeromicropila herbilytica TaxID=2785025 RepID=A0A7R7EJK3_9FIRM|nr:peptidase domain-containing ABC transporter [Anaeromicropila herbilytica]BCN29894.1 peptidase C39 [Anaeromicropila herbilytica]